MDVTKLILVVAGMALVTYIPRAIPAILADRMRFSPKMEKFLKLIPYTAMTAMIFPGVFTADATNPLIGIVGGLVATFLALKKKPVMVCVLSAIAADFLLYLIL